MLALVDISSVWLLFLFFFGWCEPLGLMLADAAADDVTVLARKAQRIAGATFFDLDVRVTIILF